MDEEALMNAAAGTSGPASGGVQDLSKSEDSTAAAGPSTAAVPGVPGLSKNAQKKAARIARQAAARPQKRAEEKERRRERAAELREGYEAGTLSPEERALVEARRTKERERRSAKRRKVGTDDDDDGDRGGEGSNPGAGAGGGGAVWGGAVLIDLGFDDKMYDQEIASMSSQISYCYSANRLAKPCVRAILHTSASLAASPRLVARLDKASRTRWARCHWFEDGLEAYVEAFNAGGAQLQVKEEQVKQEATPDLTVSVKVEEGVVAGASPAGSTAPAGPPLPAGISSATHKLVYLSADSSEELDTLREDEVYIIGGIVDRNRYKNLCQNRAEALGIRTARLPIGAYIDNLPTRKVLTVNQVYSILIEYLAKHDWKEAFETVIPTRKFATEGRRRTKGKGKSGEDGLVPAHAEDDAGGEDDDGSHDDDDDANKEGEEVRVQVASTPAPDTKADVVVPAEDFDEEAAMNA